MRLRDLPMMPRWSAAVLLVALVALVASDRVAAQDAPGVLDDAGTSLATDPERCVDALDDATVARWLPRAEADLRRTARRSRAWFVSWTVVNSFLLGASVYVARTDDDDYLHEAAIWGAVGSGISLAMLYTPPIATIHAPRRLARASGERDRLAVAIELLHDGAEYERATSAPYWHAVNGVYVLGESLVLGFRHRDDGGLVVLNGLVSLAIAESQLLSTPRGARRAVRDLGRDGYPCASERVRAGPRVRVRLAGLSVFGTF